MSSIPANLFSSVTPSVLAAGGSAIDVIGLLLTNNHRVPLLGTNLPTVAAFPDVPSVEAYFGASSFEARKAQVYFAGFDNADVLPGSILFTQYNSIAVAAYLRGGAVGNALTLAQLQALSGSLTAVVDGYSHVIASINFAADNSFSAVAAAIQAAFTDPTESSFTASLGAAFTATGTGTSLVVTSVTGIISPGDTVTGTGAPAGTTIVSGPSNGGAGTYITNQATTCAGASCTCASTVLDVTVDTDVAIAVGQTVAGAGVTGSPLITAQLTGTPGSIGTYRISGAQQHVASEAMTGVATAPLVTYDSTSAAFIITSGVTGAPSTVAFATGTLAAPLLLTQTAGAVLSQGADAATPGSFMDGVLNQTTDWVTFMTMFDPDVSGFANKELFAAWKNTAMGGDRFAYVCWDLDQSPGTQTNASASLGAALVTNGDSGTCLLTGDATAGWVHDVATDLAAMVCGFAGSIDFEEDGGRITFAFKGQAGIPATVTTSAFAINAGGNPQVEDSFGNGYNYYGAVAAAKQSFTWFQRGLVTGPFRWLDSYINQIWLNANFQGDGLTLQNNSKSIPYTVSGANLIETAYSTTITAGLNFGAFAPGTISNAQAAAVNSQAGANISGFLQTQGYYMQVLQATSTARASRTSPPCKFFYLDRGSVQALSLASVALQ